MRTPTLPDVIEAAVNHALSGVFTAMPGQILSFDVATQTATVQPLVMSAYTDEAGVRRTERPPAISDVPVCFPGAGEYAITFPIKAGDSVLIVFASCSIDRWFSFGGEVDPQDERRHSITDAIAIPGLRARPQAMRNVAADALVITGDDVRLGGHDADDPIVRKSDLDAVVSKLNSHTHPVPGITAGSAAVTSSVLTGTPFSTPACSQVVRSK